MFTHKMHCYQYIILFLFASHLIYELLLWGTHVNRVRIMSNSQYLAHSEPLLKTLKLLKIEDVYKLNLMKFY